MAEKKQDLKKKDEKDLSKILGDKESLLIKETISFTQRKIKDVHKPRKIRKEIARIKTVLRSRAKKINNPSSKD